MSVTRRSFLQASLGGTAAVALGSRMPELLAASGAKQDGRDTVLVVLQMGGGNDGLNTVVPYDDDVYARSRPTLRIKGNEVHKVGQHLGLHPRMKAFKRLLDEGCLSIVQGVGYPNQNRDHPGSMRIWQAAMLKASQVQTGWLGRAVDRVYRAEDALVPAIYFGDSSPPFAMNAQSVVIPAFRSLEQYRLQAAAGPAGPPTLRWLTDAAAMPRPGDPLAEFVARTSRAAYADSEKVEAAIRVGGASARAYPPFPLARMLSTIATLMRAEIGIRVFFTEVSGGSFGGFDNHAGQAGNHAALLEAMSESVAAFVDDLKRDRMFDRVLVMTFSEFGRTVAENGRRGTDHGAAAPMFLIGGKVKGGLLGKHPSLTDLDAGALRYHTDFRAVYATALDRWLGWDSQAVLGQQFAPLDVLRA